MRRYLAWLTFATFVLSAGMISAGQTMRRHPVTVRPTVVVRWMHVGIMPPGAVGNPTQHT